MDLRKYVLSLLLLLIFPSLISGVDVPLEEYYDKYNGENYSILYYKSEDVEILFNVSNSTYARSFPKIDSIADVGSFKSKAINRLLYLNETDYNSTIYFILTLRRPVNESFLTTLSNTYAVEFDFILQYQENGSGEFPFPPEDELLDLMESIVAEYEETYNNNSNFAFIDEYAAVKAHGNITDIINLLYENITYSIDPGPYDLLNDYPNTTFLPVSYLYYNYIAYTSCNDSLRTNTNDADGDLFAVCENDCNDSVADIHPGATELWDGIDNDCNGIVDDGIVNCFGVVPNYVHEWNISLETLCNYTEINLSAGSSLNILPDQNLTLDNVNLSLDDGNITFYSNTILDTINAIIEWIT